MPERSPRFGRVSHNANQCLKRLNNIRFYQTLKKGALRNTVAESEDSDKPFLKRKVRKNSTIKSKTVDIVFATAGEWANKEIKEIVDKEKQKESMKVAGQMILGLKTLRIVAIKTYINIEDIVNFFTLTTFIPTLSNFEIEYLNCQISDMEVMAFAHSLPKAIYLKYFSFKVIQKPGLSEECIEQLAIVLSKFESLTKFDIYFRRLGLHPRAVQDLGNRIENFGNIQCCCSKESIHIYRRGNTEE